MNYPDFLVDKVKSELQKVIDLLETGETDTEVIQEKLDEVVCAINDLQEKFDENDSEIETVARDCIGETVGYVLEWFSIPIDVEEAIRKRDWYLSDFLFIKQTRRKSVELSIQERLKNLRGERRLTLEQLPNADTPLQVCVGKL